MAYNIKYTVRRCRRWTKRNEQIPGLDQYSQPYKKSRKYRGYEYSVDVRNKYAPENGKVKTENSCSLNKSRPSRKNSTKHKKHTYPLLYPENPIIEIPKYFILDSGSSQPLRLRRPTPLHYQG